jgi:putative flippase GtrA
MIGKIKVLYQKHRELIVYVFFGGLTTLVDFGVYALMTDFLFLDIVPANIIAWTAAVIFAYATNKTIVFGDRNNSFKAVMAQFISFAGMRAASGGLSTFLLWVFAELYGFNDMIVKAVVAVAVIILNYIFSKLFIFKKSGSQH